MEGGHLIEWPVCSLRRKSSQGQDRKVSGLTFAYEPLSKGWMKGAAGEEGGGSKPFFRTRKLSAMAQNKATPLWGPSAGVGELFSASKAFFDSSSIWAEIRQLGPKSGFR